MKPGSYSCACGVHTKLPETSALPSCLHREAQVLRFNTCFRDKHCSHVAAPTFSSARVLHQGVGGTLRKAPVCGLGFLGALLGAPRCSQEALVQQQPQVRSQAGRALGGRSERPQHSASPPGRSGADADVIIRPLPTWKVETAASLLLALELWSLGRLQRQSGSFCRTVRSRGLAGWWGWGCPAPHLGPSDGLSPDALQKVFRSRRDHSPPPGPLAFGCWSACLPKNLLSPSLPGVLGTPDFWSLHFNSTLHTSGASQSPGIPHPVTHVGSRSLLPHS